MYLVLSNIAERTEMDASYLESRIPQSCIVIVPQRLRVQSGHWFGGTRYREPDFQTGSVPGHRN